MIRRNVIATYGVMVAAAALAATSFVPRPCGAATNDQPNHWRRGKASRKKRGKARQR